MYTYYKREVQIENPEHEDGIVRMDEKLGESGDTGKRC